MTSERLVSESAMGRPMPLGSFPTRLSPDPLAGPGPNPAVVAAVRGRLEAESAPDPSAGARAGAGADAGGCVVAKRASEDI